MHSVAGGPALTNTAFTGEPHGKSIHQRGIQAQGARGLSNWEPHGQSIHQRGIHADEFKNTGLLGRPGDYKKPKETGKYSSRRPEDHLSFLLYTLYATLRGEAIWSE